MIWRILGLLLIIIIIICFIHQYSFCIYNTKPTNDIIVHHGFDISWLNENIIVVYKLISPITEQLKVILPVTNRISHWMLGLKLSNNKIIICSSSPHGYIELYNANKYNNKYLIRVDTNWIAYICNKFTDIKKYTVKEFIKIYMKYYISFNRYWFFDDNCQKMTSYALHNIFGINDKEVYRENYNMGIIPEYFKAMKNKCFGKC